MIAVAGALVLLVTGAAAAYYFYERHQGRDIRGSSTVEFVPTEPTPAPPPKPTPGKPAALSRVDWPMFGHDDRRLRYLPSGLAPPFRVEWTFRARHLLEVPPVIAYGRSYIGDWNGYVYALNAKMGREVWRFRSLDAATGDVQWTFSANGPISGSATVLGKLVYFSTLKGRTYALDARSGKQVRTFPDGKYTPPVAGPDRVYVVGYTRLYGMVSR